MRVRVKDNTTMFAELAPGNGPVSVHAGRVGTTTPSKYDEYDIGVLWNEDDDPDWPCHFMWYELEIVS